MKKLIYLLIIIIMITSGSTALAIGEENNTDTKTDSQEIYKVVDSYFNFINTSMSLDSTDTSFLDNLFSSQGKEVLEYEKAFLYTKIIHHRQQEADLRLLHYEVTPIYDKIEIEGDHAYIELHISGYRIYAYDNIPQNITNEIHFFEMIATPQGWRILNHIGNEAIEQCFKSYYVKNKKDIKRTKEEVFNDIAADTMARNNASIKDTTDINSKTELISNNNISMLTYSNSYNRSAFAKYGKKWHDGANPDYIVRGNDCANFGSQCLKAAGAPYDRVAPPNTRDTLINKAFAFPLCKIRG